MVFEETSEGFLKVYLLFTEYDQDREEKAYAYKIKIIKK